MTNQFKEQVCTILRKKLNFPSHISDEDILYFTEGSLIRALTEFRVHWQDFKREMAIHINDIINTIKNG